MNLSYEFNRITNLLNNNKFENVIKVCEKLIKKKIENTQVYNFYGLAHQKLGMYEKSISNFNTSVKLEKNNYFAFNNLAVSLKAIEKYKLSEFNYKKCLEIKPDYVIGILNYANLKEHLNEIENSINLYLSALKFEAESNKNYIFSKLIRLYLSIGNKLEARKYAFKILEKNPKDISAYNLLSDIIDLKQDKSIITEMENLYNENNLTNDEIINLAFPLGKINESLKNYDKAYLYFSKGNELKRNQVHYDYSNLKTLTESIMKFFNNLEHWKIKKTISNKKIIFICGMPRSGTTLIEHIISSHKEVLATGENNSLSTFIKKNYLNNFTLNGKKLAKDIFSKENLMFDYIFNLFDEYKFSSSIFTDKSVQNFLWIGIIKIFFPNSKIILTDRNSRDVCLSIFKINFKNGFMNFAYDQKEIVEFYNTYENLVSFWKNLFKNEIYTAKYENLIEDPENEIKNMIDFCDLVWDENCLKHHKNKSAIKTASINQARNPIYKTSKNLSDNYQKQLGLMFGLLKK